METRDRHRRSSWGRGRNHQSWNVGRGILRLPEYTLSRKHPCLEQHPTAWFRNIFMHMRISSIERPFERLLSDVAAPPERRRSGPRATSQRHPSDVAAPPERRRSAFGATSQRQHSSAIKATSERRRSAIKATSERH